ncbi:Uncharacterized protein YrzB, UPF0473 family [Fictibacillus solisalsi]|uniref:UPF0473 protein SAMN04488137_2294 n=1 Tax=Fictibacillus solisalsi TaxID=459525 RepID=A0A1G9WNZ1_9BACL|nr:DUF1292 domain-containing protein [Fictibacillus solisalsi]SDM86230.1 Uncharacterized protein YrzB, UPF0473 family [Fictibacillus solisalsi]
MANEEKEHIIIPGENGEENLFEVLMTIDGSTTPTGHSYILLVPAGEDQEDDSDEQEVFPFRFVDNGEGEDDIELFPLETDEEWQMIEETLNAFQDEEE